METNTVTNTPTVSTVLEPAVLGGIIEKKNVVVHHIPVVKEYRKQKIIEIENVPTTKHVKLEDDRMQIIKDSVHETVGTPFSGATIPSAPETTVEHIEHVSNVRVADEVNVTQNTTVERHILPIVTEIREQRIIENVIEPIVRHVRLPPIIREVGAPVATSIAPVETQQKPNPVKKHRKSVSFDLHSPVVINRHEKELKKPIVNRKEKLEFELAQMLAPGSSGKVKKATAPKSKEIPNVAWRNYLVSALLMMLFGIVLSVPYWDSFNHYKARAMFSVLTMKESVCPTNTIPGEIELSASARALNRFLEMNAHTMNETLKEHRMGMDATVAMALPYRDQIRVTHVLNDSIMLQDKRCLHVPNSQKIVILYLHAGGFISGKPEEANFVYDPISKYHSKCIDMLSVNYRLVPENKIEDALEDAFDAFKYLVAHQYTHISLMGSSAGGGLAVMLNEKLIGSHLAHVHSMVLFSPWMDFTRTTNSFYTNAPYDIMFNDASKMMIFKNLHLQHTPEELEELSPLHKLNKINFQKTFLYYSQNERVKDECDALASALGGQGTVRTVQGLPHIAPLFNAFVQESNEIMNQVVQFLVNI
jgi:acetyl esterase/lipase